MIFEVKLMTFHMITDGSNQIYVNGPKDGVGMAAAAVAHDSIIKSRLQDGISVHSEELSALGFPRMDRISRVLVISDTLLFKLHGVGRSPIDICHVLLSPKPYGYPWEREG